MMAANPREHLDNIWELKYVYISMRLHNVRLHRSHTLEQTWSTCITFFLCLAGIFPALGSPACCCAPGGRMRDTIDSDSPPTTVSTLHYWLTSSATKVPQPSCWIAKATGCNTCRTLGFHLSPKYPEGILFSGDVVCVWWVLRNTDS